MIDDVSRETRDRLAQFAGLIAQWSPRINLVSKGDLLHLWDRHIRDSAQIWGLVPAVPGARQWADLGSGGGFPGLVLAILMAELAPEDRMTLVESDGRKAAFLALAAREMGLTVRVMAQRAEEVAPMGADIVTARALAPLSDLLPLVARHLREGGTAVLPKGRRFAEERQAVTGWDFALDARPSITDSDSSILILTDLKRTPRA